MEEDDDDDEEEEATVNVFDTEQELLDLRHDIVRNYRPTKPTKLRNLSERTEYHLPFVEIGVGPEVERGVPMDYDGDEDDDDGDIPPPSRNEALLDECICTMDLKRDRFALLCTLRPETPSTEMAARNFVRDHSDRLDNAMVVSRGFFPDIFTELSECANLRVLTLRSDKFFRDLPEDVLEHLNPLSSLLQLNLVGFTLQTRWLEDLSRGLLPNLRTFCFVSMFKQDDDMATSTKDYMSKLTKLHVARPELLLSSEFVSLGGFGELDR